MPQICLLAIVRMHAAAPQERVWAKARIWQLPGVVGLPSLTLFTTKVSKRKQRLPMPPRLLLGTDGSHWQPHGQVAFDSHPNLA